MNSKFTTVGLIFLLLLCIVYPYILYPDNIEIDEVLYEDSTIVVAYNLDFYSLSCLSLRSLYVEYINSSGELEKVEIPKEEICPLKADKNYETVTIENVEKGAYQFSITMDKLIFDTTSNAAEIDS